MVKFNRNVLAPPAPRGPITSTGLVDPSRPRTSMVERDAKSELFLTAVNSFLTEPNFYESADARVQRFCSLVHEVTRQDPEWMARFLPWLRNEADIRTAAIVGLAEYVRAGGPNSRALVGWTLARADEPGELLAYWMSTQPKGNKAIPAGLKRGLADAAERLYTEVSALRYDSDKAAFRFADVVTLCHAGGNLDLWRWLMDRRTSYASKDPRIEGLPIIAADAALLVLPEGERRAALRDGRVREARWSWERLASWLPGGMDREAWELVIPQMGYMALLRNLRNFDNAGVSDEVAAQVAAKLSDPAEVARSRQLPFRFQSAYNNSSIRWHYALEKALRESVSNIPALSGHTLVLVDLSGSMDEQMSTRGRSHGQGATQAWIPRRMDVACLFGAAIGVRNPGATIVGYSDSDAEVRIGIDVLAGAKAIRRAVRSGGTDTWGSYRRHVDRKQWDRVIIITDEMFNGQGRPESWDHMLYTFNVAGYKHGQVEEGKKAVTFGGLTDACFQFIPMIEAGQKGKWPF